MHTTARIRTSQTTSNLSLDIWRNAAHVVADMKLPSAVGVHGQGKEETSQRVWGALWVVVGKDVTGVGSLATSRGNAGSSCGLLLKAK